MIENNFYTSPEFWVGAAFMLVLVLLAHPVSKVIKSLLTQRIETVINNINESVQLKKDAQKLLNEYENKFKNVKNEVDDILKKSQAEIEYLKKNSLEQLEKESKLREKNAIDRMQSEKNKAQKELIDLAASLSTQSARDLIKEKLNTQTKNRLIDEAIKNISVKS